MRNARRLALLLTALTATACGRCGSRPPPPVERFVAADSAVTLVIPTLEGFARQSSDVLGTASTFPFGTTVRDARSVLAGRLGFDPFDAAAVAAAGLDPKRGLALSGRSGPRGPNAPDVVLSLPVGGVEKLEATLSSMAKERLEATERTVEPGTPEVIVWRTNTGGPIVLAYAIVERTALLSAGEAAVAAVRAAAAVPAGATLAELPAYQRASKALADGLAAKVFVPAGSPALQDLAQFKDGLAIGLRGAPDRLGISAAVPLGAREAALKAAVAGGRSAALLGQLDPAAVLVVRGEGTAGSATDPAELSAALALQNIPGAAGALVTDFVGSLAGSSAMAVSVLPQQGKPAQLQAEPLRLFTAEILLSLSDPARMTAAIQRAVDELSGGAKGKAKLAVGRNPWRFPVAGGEVAASVADGKLALAVGPAKTLEALLARSGSGFKGPTAASDEALRSPTGGLFLDVPRLAAAVKALPEAAFGPGQQGVMLKSMADQWATSAERISAVSLASGLVEGFARGELLIEVRPAGAAPAPK
jgi:hypothetical protein